MTRSHCFLASAVVSILLIAPAARADDTPADEEPASPAAPASAGQYTYDRTFVQIDPYARRPTGYQGQQRLVLRGAPLYEAIGRPDLAVRFEERARNRVYLYVGGAVLIVTGAILPFVTEEGDCSGRPPAATKQCQRDEERHETNMDIYGGIGVGVGALLIVGGWLYNPDPIGSEHAQNIARLHNTQLRRQLQLQAHRPSRLGGLGLGDSGLTLAPLAQPTAAGLVVSGEF